MPATANKTSNGSIRRTSVLLAFACAVVFAGALPNSAAALSYVVDRADDLDLQACTAAANDCTLRGAINVANDDDVTEVDTITFSGTLAIEIYNPLPSVTDQLTIDAAESYDVTVSRSGGGYLCTGSDFAIDITDPAATPTILRRLAFSDVCGRAIRSNVPAPTLAVGPRHADNSVAISGGAANATSVDLFTADTITTDGESDPAGFVDDVFASNGFWAYAPPATPVFPDAFSATATGPSGTSNFSTRAITPTDLTSPSLTSVVAVSNSRVRVDFNESLSGGSAVPTAYSLGMANAARPISGVSVFGNSVYLDSSLPWATGEAGALGITGNGRVIDAAGNELLGLPIAPVYAGPGEVETPVISNYRLQPNRLCQRSTAACKRKTTYIYITLNKPARVIFKVARGTVRRSELVTFVHRLKAGRNKVKFDAVVSGRTLPATLMTIRATAQDAARTLSAPVDTPFKVVKHKRDL